MQLQNFASLHCLYSRVSSSQLRACTYFEQPRQIERVCVKNTELEIGRTNSFQSKEHYPLLCALCPVADSPLYPKNDIAPETAESAQCVLKATDKLEFLYLPYWRSRCWREKASATVCWSIFIDSVEIAREKLRVNLVICQQVSTQAYL
jgi:hypothetical protein